MHLKKLLFIMIIGMTSAGAVATQSLRIPNCGDSFWGVVRYSDLDGAGRRIYREEKFRFREWSPEEQFDELLWMARDFGSGQPSHAIVEFQSSSGWFNLGKKRTKKIVMDPWEKDTGSYLTKEANIKAVLKEEPDLYNKFDVSLEGPTGIICTSTFSIRHGD